MTHTPEPAEAAQTGAPFAGESSPPDGVIEKKPRKRRTTAQVEADKAVALAEEQASLKPFHPSLVNGKVTATAERQLRVGQYEHYLIRVHAEMERDPRFDVGECQHMLGYTAINQIEKLVAKIHATVEFEK